MTFTYKSERVGEYKVAIEQEKFENCFIVRAYQSINECECRQIKENYYGDEKSAEARLKRLVRQFKKEVEQNENY